MKETARHWIEYAKRDFDLAKDNFDNEYYANIVIFHCQQSVEKIFKAILEENSVKFPKIHNLVMLYELIGAKTNIDFEIDIRELNQLNDIYNESRYPGEVGLLPEGFPVKEDAERIFEITDNIFHIALKILS